MSYRTHGGEIKMKVGSRRKIPQTKCPHCGANFASVFNVGDKEYYPREGAIVICVDCGHVMALDNELKPRILNRKEMREAVKRIVR
jgi:Zn ribbon nucleic-acid-binding protein